MPPSSSVVSFLLATQPIPAPVHWRPDSFGMALFSVVVFTLVGIVMAIVGFKIWDRLTPGNLEEEICRKQNIAAAILGAAIILGTCLVVAAAMLG